MKMQNIEEIMIYAKRKIGREIAKSLVIPAAFVLLAASAMLYLNPETIIL